VTAGHLQPVLRRATLDDAEALAALDTLVNPSPWTPAQFLGACGANAAREIALVLEDGGQLVGFMVYSRILDEGSIHGMAVHPRWQRRGLGAALLSEALERLRADGARRCQLELRASNTAARALYEALGFAPDGLRRNYYPLAAGREDALLMSLSLYPRVPGKESL